ncbi:MAG: MFS transporter [Ferroplasma sp.]|uniref:MFS transporter n=1 Tax=Ferroplasma sp. TaxID=2591003 RepID=UPI002815FBC8|nr:MFS transporter [Ferroplasma sp.]WMT50710.1 MAG: MFS transporter [Ferroplasma sp.]
MLTSELYHHNKSAFVRYLVSRNIARFSNTAYYIYFMWEIIANYHSVLLVSLIPGFSFLGYLIIAIPEGSIIDRYDRHLIYIIINLMMVITYSFLIAGHGLFIIYAVDFLSSMFMWVVSDDFRALTKEIIPADHMAGAQSADQLSSGIFTLAGILVGGAFIFMKYNYVYELLIGISILAMAMIFIPNTVKVSNRSNVRNGFRSTFKIMKSIIPFLLLTLILNGMFVAIDVFASGLVYIVMHASSIYYTFFIAGFPAGMLAGGIMSMHSIFRRHQNSKGLMALYIFLTGIIFVLISFNRIPIMDGVLTFFSGVILAFVNIYIETMVINSIPSSITGKFNSLTAMFSVSSSPVMAFVFGYASGFLYFPYIITIVGVIMLISSFTVIRIMDGFNMAMERIEKENPELF